MGDTSGQTNCSLELEVEGESDTILVELVASRHSGHVGVVEAAHVLDGEHLEDVADADGELHVRLVTHDEGGLVTVAGGETEEVVVACLDEGVVLVGKVPEEHLEADVLTQLQLFEERNAVEDFSVEVPVDEQGDVAVVEELHVAEHVERPAVELHEVGEVGLWGEEHGEGHFVPLHTTLQIGFDAATGTRKPEFLEEGGLGHVVVVLSS